MNKTLIDFNKQKVRATTSLSTTDMQIFVS